MSRPSGSATVTRSGAAGGRPLGGLTHWPCDPLAGAAGGRLGSAGRLLAELHGRDQAVNRTRAVALATALVLSGLAIGWATAAPAVALEQRLVAPDGAPGDELGNAVAVDGDTAVLGAREDDAGRGAVYVFTRAGNAWLNTAKLTASDRAPGDGLGDSVAIDGDTIVAGANTDDVVGDANQGSVYTFARMGAAARVETAKLTATDGADGDFLGSAVAIEGDTIVAGAVADDIGMNAAQGSVYTFTRVGDPARNQTAKLTTADGAAGDRLGGSVAVNGDTIVAGAGSDDIGANTDQGSAYTFARTGAVARTETAKLTSGDGDAGDDFGRSVALAGDAIAVATPEDDIAGESNRGSAFTFARSGAPARTETAKLTTSDSALGDLLGQAVAVDGETIAVGACCDDIAGVVNTGSVYTFSRTGAGSRTETAKLFAADGANNDQLGISVAIDGDAVVAGAPFDDVGTNADQGSAVVFFTPAGAPGPGGTAPGRPLVRGFDFAPNRIAVGRRRTPVGAAAHGGAFRYRLNAAAQVTIVIQRKRAGRRRGRRCVAPRPGLRRRCIRYRRRGALRRDGRAGRNRVRFSGRIGRRVLAPGAYRATITAINAGGTSKRRTTSFEIVKPNRGR
jgi:hypothetical protein